MRLSGLFVAALLLSSAILVAQHSSGGGGGGGGGSHGSSSGGSSYGGSSSIGSSHVSSTGGSGSSHSSSSSSSSSSSKVSSSAGGSNARSHATASSSAKPEKKGFFSFLGHKKPAAKSSIAAAFKLPIGCKKGQNCTCLGGGTRNAGGNCVFPTQVAWCSVGAWNGYSCGAEGWFNDCRDLADQLAAQGRQLQRRGVRESLRYRLLEDQYDYCQHAFHYTLPWLAISD